MGTKITRTRWNVRPVEKLTFIIYNSQTITYNTRNPRYRKIQKKKKKYPKRFSSSFPLSQQCMEGVAE